MKYVEWILAFLGALAFGLSLWSQPQMAMFAVLCLFLLGIVYFFLGFFLMQGIGFGDLNEAARKKQLSVGRTMGSAGLGIALSMLVMGVLFQMQLWTGGKETLLMGLAVVGVALVIVAVKWFKGRAAMYHQLLIRLSVAVAVGLVFLLVSPYTWQKIRHRDDIELLQVLEHAEANPEDEEAMKALVEVQRQRYEAQRKKKESGKKSPAEM